MANLDAYTSVKTGLFVRLQVDEYRTSTSNPYTEQVLTFSDFDATITINSEDYVPLGKLLNISPSSSELRSSSNTITVTLSGVPTNSIAEIVHSRIKGAPIKIYRGYFDIATDTLIDTVEARFIGSVNNYSIQEEYDIVGREANNMLLLECASSVDLLSRKIAGRKTNPESHKKFYPTDTAMDRVPTLKGTKFDFGAQ